MFSYIKPHADRRVPRSTPRRPGHRLWRKARIGLEGLEERLVMSPLVYAATGAGEHVIVLEDVGAEIEIFDNKVLKAKQAQSHTSSVKITGADVASTVNPGSKNVFDINQTVVPTTINMGSAQDQAFVGVDATDAGVTNVDLASVQGIKGALTIHGSGGMGAVTVDDRSNTQAVTATISSSSITGLAPAPINYTGINQLTVYGSKGSGNQYTITGGVGPFSGPGTTLNDESPTDTVTVRSGSGKVSALGLRGDVITLYGSSVGGSVLNAYPQNADIGKPGVYDSSESGFSNAVFDSQSNSDSAALHEGGPSWPSLYTSFGGNAGGFGLSGGGQNLTGHGFEKAYGLMQNTGVFWTPAMGPLELTGTILSLYEQRGGGGLGGILNSGADEPGTYGMPTGSVPGTGLVNFQNGAIFVSPVSGAPLQQASVFQNGNTLEVLWQCNSPIDRVLVGYEVNASQQVIQSSQLGVSGLYTINVSPVNTYRLFLDMGRPGNIWDLWAPHWTGWTQTFTYMTH